jgi:hypothetical protein
MTRRIHVCRLALCTLLLTLAACGGATRQHSATAVATDTPEQTIGTLGSGDEPLDPGTYRMDLNALGAGAAEFPAFLITLPEGWHNLDGWIVNRPNDVDPIPPVAVQFWDVHQVYGHPCQWSGTIFEPGPTVDELAEALVDIPLRNATEPIDVTLDSYAGTYLEWSVPAEIDFDACDEGFFESWTANGWASDRYQQAPAQVDRLWILDIDGARLVIDAFSMPYATPDELEELLAVVESIRFER